MLYKIKKLSCDNLAYYLKFETNIYDIMYKYISYDILVINKKKFLYKIMFLRCAALA